MASSLVMIRLRSISTPGTLRGCDPVATMISFVACSVCGCSPVTSTLPLPVRRAVPLIQSILFLRNRNSTPLVSEVTTLSLRACTCFMSRLTEAPSIERPHSLAARATLSAWACSRSALVGMHPQIRHVPPRAFCFSTTATRSPSCAARMAAG